jgi:hypothetical protein
MGTAWKSSLPYKQAFWLNEIEDLGTVGTVFHACCLLETTPKASPIGVLPTKRCGCEPAANAVGPGQDGQRPVCVLPLEMTRTPVFLSRELARRLTPATAGGTKHIEMLDFRGRVMANCK